MGDSFCQFKRDKGHACVPHGYKDHDGFALGEWVVKQRQLLGPVFDPKTMRDYLEKRIAMLNAEQFVWKVSDEDWMVNFGKLAAFRKEHGHCRVPKGLPLNNWCTNQRSRCKSPDRIELLDSLFLTGIRP